MGEKVAVRLPFILTAAAMLAVCIWMPKNAETKVNPAEMTAPARVVVHMEHNEPVNVYSDEIPLSQGWQAYTQDTCRRYGVDYSLMLGLMETESSFRFDADSGWAVGICQIGYINEEWLAEQGIDIYSNMGNIEAGCMILSDYLTRYTEEQALMAYNMGEYGAAEKWESGIYSSEYSEAVLQRANYWNQIIKEAQK